MLDLTMLLSSTGLFAMTEQRLQDSKFHKWVMCPTCRQHTELGNIAYAVDGQHESFDTSVLQNVDSSEKFETSISVKGSYGTKVFFLATDLFIPSRGFQRLLLFYELILYFCQVFRIS